MKLPALPGLDAEFIASSGEHVSYGLMAAPPEAIFCANDLTALGAYEAIKERGLRMRLSGIEHLWGGERIVFYFTATTTVLSLLTAPFGWVVPDLPVTASEARRRAFRWRPGSGRRGPDPREERPRWTRCGSPAVGPPPQ